MNWQHLQAFLWLRWRLQVNQLKRGGIANVVIRTLLAVLVLFTAVSMFLVALVLGSVLLPEASPTVLMYVWDGLLLNFLLWWAIGVLMELQRSEPLSLEKFLHLPVSLSGAFLINYLASLFSLSVIIFVPAMVGLCIGMVIAKGPAMLLVVPSVAAFLLLVTALTYQFQGWLATLMVNKRRRRAIIVIVTMSFVLLAQVPNLVNLLQPWKRRQQEEQQTRLHDELAELNSALVSGRINAEQYWQRHREIQERQREWMEAQEARVKEQVEDWVKLINVVVPLGWMPLAAMATAEGNFAPALLGTLGLTLIGAASLWRSYRTTLRLYTGQFSTRKRPAKAPAPAAGPVKPSRLLDMNLPWLSEQASIIALACFRSLLRAPEVKMMFLTPILLVLVFGSLFLAHSFDPPEFARPLFAFGGMGLVLLSMAQLLGNQFGFDRAGFRAYVLCSADRKDILLGKNVAFAPLTLGLGLLMVAVLECIYPMRVDRFVAMLLQLPAMYLLYCLLANWMSIMAPMPIASGTLKPVRPKGLALLLHVLFTFVSPLVLAPTLIPMGLELAVEGLTGIHGWPIGLVLSLVQLVLVAFIYQAVLGWEGELLQKREQRILETVTAKVE